MAKKLLKKILEALGEETVLCVRCKSTNTIKKHSHYTFGTAYSCQECEYYFYKSKLQNE
jgi:transposase-like protein